MGHPRDERKHKARRAMKIDYGINVPNPNSPGVLFWKSCIVMRWESDEPFRQEMKKLHYTREDVIEVDGIADHPGNNPLAREMAEGARARPEKEPRGTTKE